MRCRCNVTKYTFSLSFYIPASKNLFKNTFISTQIIENVHVTISETVNYTLNVCCNK